MRDFYEKGHGKFIHLLAAIKGGHLNHILLLLLLLLLLWRKTLGVHCRRAKAQAEQETHT